MGIQDYSTTPVLNGTAAPGVTMLDTPPTSLAMPMAVRQIMADIAAAKLPLTPLMFNAAGDGIANDAPAFASFKTKIDANTETIGTIRFTPQSVAPRGIYLLNSDVQIPANFSMMGRASGPGKLIVPFGYQLRYGPLAATSGVQVNGQYLGRIDGIFGALIVNGGGSAFGSFWNEFQQINGDVDVNLANFSCNFDRYSQVKTVSTGIRIQDGPAGTGVFEGHANIFSHVDATYGGIHNTASVQQTNYIQFGYYDALVAADIVGPFHIYGLNGDASHPPLIDRRHHLLATTDQLEKNRADFFRMGLGNFATGGNWDYLVAGIPACMTTFGGTASVQADATEPSGVGKRLQLVCSATFQGFSITLPPCPSARFGLKVWYKGSDFESVDVNRTTGGGTVSNYDGSAVAANADGWKEYKLSGIAATNAVTVVHLYVNSATAASKTTSIGGFSAGPEKATPEPMAINRPAKRSDTATSIYGHMTQHGQAAFTISSGTFVDVVVTFPFVYATPPFVMAGTVSVSGSAIASWQGTSTTTATIRVFGAIGVTGSVTYVAIGDAP